jgi:hypothetical protein
MSENPVAKKEEADVLQLRAQLEAELKRHDWYYSYSDDGRAYRAGNAHAKQIDGLYKKFSEVQGEAAAKELWNSIAPKDYQKK